MIPCSSVFGLISSFTTIIFLKKSFNLVNDFFSCTIFSGDVISNADYVIDMGPGGGMDGGRIAAAGTPDEVAANPRSITGKYLRK